MKRFLAVFFSVAIVFTLLGSTVAFADSSPTVSELSIQANSDYNYHWHNKGEATSGTFTVSGSNGDRVRMTLAIASFDPDTHVEIAVYGGNSTSNLITSVSSWIANGLTTGGIREWVTPETLIIRGYDTYTIQWSIIPLYSDSSGRVLCWVY